MLYDEVKIKNYSLAFSVSTHLLIFAFLFFLGNKFYEVKQNVVDNNTIDEEVNELVEVSFGTGLGTAGEPGGGKGGEKITTQLHPPTTPITKTKKMDKNVINNVDIPQADSKNRDAEKIIDKTTAQDEISKNPYNTDGKEGPGLGVGSGTGGDGGKGYYIDWGGRGTRRITSYIIPKYPAGIYKNVDIKVEFSILPNGSVGTVRLINKADATLEGVALSSIKRWKFEPLNVDKVQRAIITFPFRIR
ncbi:MAG: energy transducer TonB [Syntrophothermus sp.]